ncbi:MAG TPA: tetratricopeptide repeat protein [Gaiellaceae bacterium]|jgi:tetratricopeptide (TPR) repeat protein|nr:tetratricopeptide repeat protein [Gaiellaceae bacterium]
MFFPKLRRRAKWVFLLLAVVFLGGYLVFSVGTGAGSGIGDYLSDIFNRQPGAAGPSVDEARERLADNPQDPQAQLELARALQTDGQVEQAIAAYERYTTTRPRDEDGLRALASLYGLEAAEAQRRFEQASGEAGAARIQQQFAPSSPFAQALTENAIVESVAGEADARAQAAQAEAQRYGALQTDVYQRLTLLVDDDPLLWLQFAQAAETAARYDSAITAYERFLELAPDDSSAEQVRDRIELLRSFAGASGDQ